MMQYRSLAPVAAAAALLAAFACNTTTDPSNPPTVVAPSFASSHTEPGTPGDPNCKGQTTAFLAQAGKNGLTESHGIGGIARDNGLTVQEVKAIVDEFCAG